ncbi:MAG: hypothetical protein HF981_22820 [Desulfobacteraceae bacterium]|nr:hypothetical protein [Desulfobacteraceae bacterium]MBC2753249.1 RsbRD N-terminal domain-containing protein [Desulfobacteraceae bacterium]
MRLEQRITKHKRQIANDWFAILAGTYPPDTTRFLKTNKDTFTNPVGGTSRRTLEAVLDALLENAAPDHLAQQLDALIRIRAVQTMFTPSQATAFILDLKKIIRDTLKSNLQDADMQSQLLQFEARIDRLLLIAFDIFVRCREKIYAIKATEEQSKIYRAFARAGLVRANPDIKPDAGVS